MKELFHVNIDHEWALANFQNRLLCRNVATRLAKAVEKNQPIERGQDTKLLTLSFSCQVCINFLGYTSKFPEMIDRSAFNQPKNKGASGE